MRTPCEYVIKYLLPRLRAKIADVLIEEFGWKQVEVAKLLKVTQPAVSKYKEVLKVPPPIPVSYTHLTLPTTERV